MSSQASRASSPVPPSSDQTAEAEATRLRAAAQRRRQRLLGHESSRMHRVGVTEDVPLTTPNPMEVASSTTSSVSPTAIGSLPEGDSDAVAISQAHYVALQSVARAINFVLLLPLAFLIASQATLQQRECWLLSTESSLLVSMASIPIVQRFSGLGAFLAFELFCGLIIHHQGIIRFARQNILKLEPKEPSLLGPGLTAMMGLSPSLGAVLDQIGPAMAVGSFLLWVIKDFTVFVVLYQVFRLSMLAFCH